MESLMSVLESELNMDPQAAEKASEIISRYFKERVPGFMESTIERIVAGESVENQIKDKTSQFTDQFKSKTEELTADLKSAFEKAFGPKAGK